MTIDLSGKKAMVCGSTQGIGKASARALAAQGAEIVLVARNEASLQKVCTELDAAAGQKHSYLVADFSEPGNLRKAVSDYLKNNGPVHILVNNTGGPASGPITEAETGQFEKTFSQHLICNHILVQACLPGMKSEKYGRIINIISTSVKQPLKGLGVSNTIRAAVANWSKTLAGEVAPFEITVNNVLPGATLTERLRSLLAAKSERTGKPVSVLESEMLREIPAGRFGNAEDIAAAVAFLASPAASYITGINLPVDGGRTSSL